MTAPSRGGRRKGTRGRKSRAVGEYSKASRVPSGEKKFREALSPAFLARIGSGSGRPPGARDKRAVDLAARLEAMGADPALVLVEFMLNKKLPREFRAECAGKLMPYRYPRLTSTEISAAAGMLGDVVINIVADLGAGGADDDGDVIEVQPAPPRAALPS